MLILSRKQNESIIIGENIEITISSIDGDQVKVAISAPRSIDVYRKEIFIAIQEQNRQSLKTNDISILKNFNKKN